MDDSSITVYLNRPSFAPTAALIFDWEEKNEKNGKSHVFRIKINFLSVNFFFLNLMIFKTFREFFYMRVSVFKNSLYFKSYMQNTVSKTQTFLCWENGYNSSSI